MLVAQLIYRTTVAAWCCRRIISMKENTMARGRRSKSIKAIAGQRLEDGAWGIPESPEFSSVQRLMNEIQSQTIQEERWLSRYREIARESTDPLIRFLLGLIVAD